MCSYLLFIPVHTSALPPWDHQANARQTFALPLTPAQGKQGLTAFHLGPAIAPLLPWEFEVLDGEAFPPDDRGWPARSSHCPKIAPH